MNKNVRNVIGIDISKLTFDVCFLFASTKPTYATFNNDKAGCEKFLSWLERHEATDAHICMESTGTYSLAPALFLQSRGFLVSIVNPFLIKAFGDSELARNKTDRADALLIAKFCKEKQPRPWSPPSSATLQLRSLTSRYQDLQEDRTRVICRLEAAFDGEARAFWQGRLAEIDSTLKATQTQLRSLCAANEELARQCRLLASIPGIGETTALLLLAEIPDIRSFRNAKQLAAFAGLTPANRSSGTSVKKQSRLSKRGSSSLRRILFMPALCARRYNPVLRAFAEGLLQRGKKKMAVIGALMRKLMHCIYGVLKSGQPFNAARAAGAY
jgi:transposase